MQLAARTRSRLAFSSRSRWFSSSRCSNETDSELLLGISGSLLLAAYQTVFDELAHVVEDRSDVRLQPTFFSERPEGRLPFRRRYAQACWQGVSPPSIKRQAQRVDHPPPVKIGRAHV